MGLNTQKMIRRSRRFVRRERGAQIVELAFVLPFLFVLFAMVTEVGRYFYVYRTLSQATVVGTRFLSTTPLSSGVYKDADKTSAKNLVLCGNAAGCGGTGQPAAIISSLTLSHIPDPVVTGGGPNKTVTMSISGYTYQPVFNLGSLMHDDSFSLAVEMKPSTTMRYMP